MGPMVRLEIWFPLFPVQFCYWVQYLHRGSFLSVETFLSFVLPYLCFSIESLGNQSPEIDLLLLLFPCAVRETMTFRLSSTARGKGQKRNLLHKLNAIDSFTFTMPIS
jgi:hypothetical protein